jgi:hypothetical protein
MDMLARKQKNARLKQALLAEAKRILKERGWTYRTAAPVCQVRFEHFGKVLCGMRESGVLLRRIHELPPRNLNEQANA